MLALISRILSVGGRVFDAREVLRRDKDGLINDDDDEPVEEGAIWGGS